MAVARVQSAAGRTTASQDSYTLAFGSNVTAGNFIVVGAMAYNAASIVIANITDTLGHTYVLAEERTAHSGSTAAIAYVANISGGANSVTINVTGSNFYALVIEEWSGVATSSPLTGTAQEAAGTGTTATLTDITPGADGTGFAWGVMTHESAGDPTLTVGSGWTLGHEDENTTFVPYNSMYRTTTASTAVTPSWTIGASVDWIGVAAAFKEAVGGGGGGTPAPTRGLAASRSRCLCFLRATSSQIRATSLPPSPPPSTPKTTTVTMRVTTNERADF